MTIGIAPPPLTITPATLATGTIGAPYSQALNATGGTPAYVWSVTGTLPPGLRLVVSTGAICGVPSAAGTWNVTAVVHDSENPAQTASHAVSITVAPSALKITTSSLLSVASGSAYSQTLQASGGTPAYKWTITSGSLPAGLTLTASTGTISGTPTTGGTSNFTATVTDSSSPAQSASISTAIVVTTTPLTITAPALPSVVVGTAYSQAFQASGGIAPYKWSIASGALPGGLTLNSSTGAISGTPTTSGTSSFTAAVTDSSSPAQSASISAAVVVKPTPLTIAAPALPSVIVGTAYSQALQASGGTAPYKWSVTSGALPAGVTLTPSTGAISGTPTASGTSTFTATVTDSSNPAQSASVASSIVVKPTPLTVPPATLPAVTVGTPYSQSLKASGGTAPYTWSVSSGKLPAGLTLVPSTGSISGTPTAPGMVAFTATVIDSSSPSQAASTSASVMIAPTLLTITSSALPAATGGAGYTQTLQAAGGTAPYAWSVTSGQLPAGLVISASTGAITGTPSVGGTSKFTATVTDSGSPAQSSSATMQIVAMPTALNIVSTALSSATYGTAYSQTLQAVGGTAPYLWSVSSGQLPAGLSISATTGAITGTPTSGGTFSFTATVMDSSSPAQTMSASFSIVASASPLTILSFALPSATTGVGYSQVLQASGGTPAYRWSITSGNLPAGLSLAGTTGVISGTPTSSGSSSFTATVTDSSSPAQTRSVTTSITTVAAAQVAPGPGTTWYVRPDGGTRYSANMPAGQCDGKTDVAYPGSGINQHCAYNDFRYLYDDNSGNAMAWVIAGGDTVLVRGCSALPGQQNPDNPHCRIGWDHSTGSGPDSSWCYGVGNYVCFNPPIPAGTALQHTRFLGQNYAACNTGGATNPKIYANNLTQLFGGFDLGYVFDLRGTSYVDFQCLEITAHNGVCTSSGSPSYPRGCNTSQPLDDFAGSGFFTNNATSNITFQDVYIHGFNSNGLFGPIGGPIAMTRMFVGFNEFAAWNFDDGHSTPDAPGSSIVANHIIMEGNGCYEEYPIVDGFPARICYDTNSQGFGDSWSGQNTVLDSFYCNDCQNLYNTKDGFIGPHTWISNLTVTNSVSIGNMGQNWKWGGSATPNNTTFTDNLTVGNCMRMSQPLPGAPSGYNKYLSGFCRAAGNVVASDIPAGSTWVIANNTWVSYQPTTFDIACPPGYSPCPSTVNITNNVFLGYANPNSPYGLSTPALYYIEDPTIKIVASHNVEYGMRNGDCQNGGTGNICSDPLFVGEPAQGMIPPESTLDNFNFNLASGSPAIGAGATYSALPATDYYGNPTTNPPVIGAVNP